MRLSLNDAELRIRDEVRAFLAENLPAPEEIPAEFDARVGFLRGWQRKLYDAGLVNVTWPEEYGGRGATLMEQIVVNQELARAGAPPLIGEVGLEVVGPTIVAQGTPEQKSAYLKRILSGEDIWCQGFSEPNAGSDLASLRTRAEDRGDHFVIDGQKTWTSWAQYASFCAVLARTDPDAPPHRGISYLIVGMRTEGIDVRPLVQITGDAEFSEVYFDGVVVPRENVLGELNGGWKLAMHTLTNERGPVVLSHQVKLRVALDALAADALRHARDGVPAIEHPHVRDSLVRAHVAVEVLRYHAYRSTGATIARGVAGVETSVDKLQMTTADKLVGDACLDVLGALSASPDGAPDGIDPHRWQHLYLHTRASSIYGGTSQIQKSIVAERILGLPRSR
jgi:alkylation response protein AidB-like acyl-CoA dehydrogenase